MRILIFILLFSNLAHAQFKTAKQSLTLGGKTVSAGDTLYLEAKIYTSIRNRGVATDVRSRNSSKGNPNRFVYEYIVIEKIIQLDYSVHKNQGEHNKVYYARFGGSNTLNFKYADKKGESWRVR